MRWPLLRVSQRRHYQPSGMHVNIAQSNCILSSSQQAHTSTERECANNSVYSWPLRLLEHTTLDLNAVHSPSLATIRSHQVTRGARCAFGISIVGVSNIHDDLGVDILVSGVGATGSSLAFSRSTPSLGHAGVYSRCQSCTGYGRCNREITCRESGDDFAVDRHSLVILLGGVVVLVCEPPY